MYSNNGGGGHLPYTGAESLAFAACAAGLIFAGLLALRVSRIRMATGRRAGRRP